MKNILQGQQHTYSIKNIRKFFLKRNIYHSFKISILMLKSIIKVRFITIQQYTNMKKVLLILVLIYTAYSFGFGDAIDSISNAANSIVSGATNTIRSAGQAVISSTTSALNQLQSKTTSVISEATNAVSNTVNTAIITAKSMASDAVEVVKSTAGTVVNQVQSAASGALQFVKNKVNELIEQIKNLSDYMCQHECTSFYNLPCFMLFRCTSKLKKFGLYIGLPIVVGFLFICGFCCGFINFKCLLKFLGILTGIYIIILVYQCAQAKGQKKVEENVSDQNAHNENVEKVQDKEGMENLDSAKSCMNKL